MRTPTLFAGLLAGLLSGTLPAQTEDITAALHEVRAAMKKGRFKPALETLRKAIATHHQGMECQLRREEITDLLRQCEFRVAYPPKKAKDLIAGKLRSASRSGQLTVEYQSLADSDFVDLYAKRRKEYEAAFASGVAPAGPPPKRSTPAGWPPLCWHPIAFDGPHTIEISGSHYPGAASMSRVAVGIRVMVCARDTEMYEVRTGSYQDPDGLFKPSVANYAAIRHIEGGESSSVIRSKPSPFKDGSKYKIKVKVTSSMIELYCNGKALVKAKRKVRGKYGSIALIARHAGKMTIKGKASPAWLQSVVDEQTEKDRAKFDKSFRPENRLPKSLTERLPRCGDLDGPSSGSSSSSATVTMRPQPGRSTARESARCVT